MDAEANSITKRCHQPKVSLIVPIPVSLINSRRVNDTGLYASWGGFLVTNI